MTGSAYLVEHEHGRVLIDCGMIQGEQGSDARNRALAVASPKKLDCVLLTHAHLDHCGRLPLLMRAGYKGRILTTPASIELTSLILRDSAKIQQHDSERMNRKLQRAGRPLVAPLYSLQEVESTLQLLSPVPYRTEVDVAPGVKAAFFEAGHMLGSASILLTVTENGRQYRILFSGDLGPIGAPILKDYERPSQADAVVLESTYGDRDHRDFQSTVDEFFAIIKDSLASGGKMLVPTFAVGRAQMLMLLLAGAFRNGTVQPFPIYLDSPMAIEANNIYMHHPELYDEEVNAFIKQGSVRADLATLRLTSTADESKQINSVEGSCMVMAGAGMCNAGRILHHLKQNLWRPETHVLIVGYQARGSLGRMLVEGVQRVKIYGEEIAVRAKIHTLGGFSAHAGQTDLVNWFGSLAPQRPRLFLTHGENAPRQALAAAIASKYNLQAELPEIKQTIPL